MGEDDWMDQGGIPLEMPSNEMDAFFGPAFEHTKLWKIDDENFSLFETHYAHPDEEYDSSYERSVMAVDPEIEEACGEDVACLVDGRAFGKEAAEEYKSNPASKRSPPSEKTVDINSATARSNSIDIDIFEADECPEYLEL